MQLPAAFFATSTAVLGITYLDSAFTQAVHMNPPCLLTNQSLLEVFNRSVQGTLDLFDQWIGGKYKSISDLDVPKDHHSITVRDTQGHEYEIGFDDQCSYLRSKADVGFLSMLISITTVAYHKIWSR